MASLLLEEGHFPFTNFLI